MNKKYIMFGLLGIFAIGLVAAAIITQYGSVEQEINITSPIVIEGDTTSSISGFAPFSEKGSPITITNIAPFDVEILVSDISSENVTVEYVATLELSKKEVNFSKDIWETVGGTIDVEYTVIADKFSATTTHPTFEKYVLIYYADNDNRFANPGQAVLVEYVSENLPGVNDENADLNNYSEEYPTTPFGAKIWYVPFSALTLNENAYDIDWGKADKFYFETSLIQYDAEGEIIMYPNMILEITPVYSVGKHLTASETITTTIA